MLDWKSLYYQQNISTDKEKVKKKKEDGTQKITIMFAQGACTLRTLATRTLSHHIRWGETKEMGGVAYLTLKLVAAAAAAAAER